MASSAYVPNCRFSRSGCSRSAATVHVTVAPNELPLYTLLQPEFTKSEAQFRCLLDQATQLCPAITAAQSVLSRYCCCKTATNILSPGRMDSLFSYSHLLLPFRPSSQPQGLPAALAPQAAGCRGIASDCISNALHIFIRELRSTV